MKHKHILSFLALAFLVGTTHAAYAEPSFEVLQEGDSEPALVDSVPPPLFAAPGAYIQPSTPSELKVPLPGELQRPGWLYPAPPKIPAEAPILIPSGMQMRPDGIAGLKYDCNQTARLVYHLYMRATFWDKYRNTPWTEDAFAAWNRLLAQYMEYVNTKCNSDQIVQGGAMAECLKPDSPFQKTLTALLAKQPILDEDWIKAKEVLNRCMLYSFIDPKL